MSDIEQKTESAEKRPFLNAINVLLLAIFVIVSVLGVVGIIQSKAGTQKTSPEKLLPQKSESNNVIVEVTPQILTPGKNPVFQITFETHSVDLSFDVAQISSLTDDKGRALTEAVWEGSPPGGHHRAGILTFATPLPQTKYVELTLKDIAAVPERKFHWDL